MTRNLLLLVVLLASCRRPEAEATAPAIPADPRGCLKARVLHHEHTDDADGVSHDVRYAEQFVRCDGHVWTVRILPSGRPARHEEHGHREMPPTFELARLVTKSDNGRGRLALVDPNDKQVITISPESEDAMHFDGDFDGAWHLLGKRALDAMKPTGAPAPVDAEWRETKSERGTVRVLWSRRYDVPLALESTSANGARHDELKLELEPLPNDHEFPWRGTPEFTQKSDQDFMD